MRRIAALKARTAHHARNSGWSLAEYLFYPLLMLAATPVLVKHLGTGGFGLLMLVNAIAGVGGAATLGMGAATIKFVSARRGTGDTAGAVAVVRATLALALIGSLLLGVAIVAASPYLARTLFSRMGETRMVTAALCMAALMLVLIQLDTVVGAAIKGLEQFGVSARLEMVFKCGVMVLAITAAVLTGRLAVVLAVMAVVMLVAVLVKAITVARLMETGTVAPSLQDRDTVRAVLRFGLWNWLSSIGSVLFLYADRLIIGAVLGAGPLSYYSVSAQLAQQVHALPSAAMSFLFPLMSRKAQGSDAAAVARVRRYGVMANLALSSLLGGGMLLLGPWLLQWWMGPEFARQSTDVLLWLTLAYLILSLNVAPYYLLLGHDEARYVSVVNLAGGGIGVAATVLLTPLLGTVGAAMARAVLGIAGLANYWKLYRIKPAPPAATV